MAFMYSALNCGIDEGRLEKSFAHSIGAAGNARVAK